MNRTAQNQSGLQAAFEVNTALETSADATNTKDAFLAITDWACLFGVTLLVAAFYRCTQPQPNMHSDNEALLEPNVPE